MDHNKRRFDREPVAVPCTVSSKDDADNSAPARIINLSEGGVMLAAEQGFMANERVSIVLEDGYDTLLFEFAEILTGTVRWSQAMAGAGQKSYHVGVALERALPHRIVLTEQ
jgi:hypothetical protein